MNLLRNLIHNSLDMIEFTEREIRIISAALDRGKENVFSPIVLRQTKVNNAFGIGFIEGALWADEHPKSPWISVEERLPETNDGQSLYEVIVATSDRRFLVVINTEVEPLVGLLGVTHWIYIPEFNEK